MSVTRRTLPSGDVSWRARVFWQPRVVAQQSFDRRSDAKRWEADQLAKLASGGWIDPARGSGISRMDVLSPRIAIPPPQRRLPDRIRVPRRGSLRRGRGPVTGLLELPRRLLSTGVSRRRPSSPR